ncbi:mce related protein [Burkholderiales bacterium JOSHI_001]|nr:mce related protein [Burkholderiales bacterium JOSHI_001]
MKRRANPTLIGLFVVGALVLALGTVIALAGGSLFQRKERAVMYFSGSIYGLQVGAPVVFRGVRLGSVVDIGLAYDKKRENFAIPVTAEIERGVVRGGRGNVDADAAPSVAALVQRGLRAQLAMQSILTGQLYVDLDFRPDRAGEKLGAAGGPTEIPTVSNSIQDLQNQIEGLDLRKLVDDVSAIAGSARQLVSGPELAQALRDTQAITTSLKSITRRLDKQIDPLVAQARGALSSTERAMNSTDTAMKGAERTLASADAAVKTAESTIKSAQPALAQLEGAVQRIDTAAARVGALASPDAPLLKSLQATADELSRSAAALRDSTADDGTLMLNLQRALRETSQAARSLRELTDLLDRQPESLLRGRQSPR